MPFPRVVSLFCGRGSLAEDFNLMRVLLFCRKFSEVEAPDEIHVKMLNLSSLFERTSFARDFASLPNLKSLDFSHCNMDVELAHELFQRLPDFAGLTELVLPDVPEINDWEIVAEALTASKTLEKVSCTLLRERGDCWARALGAGLCAETPLSSISLRICGRMGDTALQAFEKLFLNKSLFSVAVIVKGGMSHSLAVTLSKALAGETAVKFLDLSIFGKLSFYCANLIERGIVKNNSLGNLVVSLLGELPDNWQAIVENLNVRLAEKANVTYQISPKTFSPVTATQLTDFLPCVIKHGLFGQESVTLNVWGELTFDGAEALYNVVPCTSVCHLTLNIHGKLTGDFLHYTARHIDKQKRLCPITINTWDQLTSEGEALFKVLELDKNPAVTLNVCEVSLPSDESADIKVVSIDNTASLISLLESAENTGKENLRVAINFQSDDSTYTGCSLHDSLPLGLARYCSLTSLTLTMNNFSLMSSELFTLISALESCISLKSLNLTLNEYNRKWARTSVSCEHGGLRRNTSLISLTLTLNIFTGSPPDSYFDFINISHDDVVPNISINPFTLTINDLSSRTHWGLSPRVLWSNCKSLNTFNLTINNWGEVRFYSLPSLLNAVITENSMRTLRLKINDWTSRNGVYPKYDFSGLVVKSPSLELIELTICRYGVEGTSIETLKWEKQ